MFPFHFEYIARFKTLRKARKARQRVLQHTAQIVKRPGPGLLAFLLGVAIGVMFTLSAAEMYIRNAYEHGFWSISAAVLGGVALYYFLQPFLPDFADHSHGKKASEVGSDLTHSATLQLWTCLASQWSS